MAGTIPTTGTARVLVVACNPTDSAPTNAAVARQNIVDAMANVTKFYHQASDGVLNVQVDVTTHVALLNNANYYHRANGADGYPNIDSAVLDQLMAECAQGAVDQGFDLNDYEVLVASVYLPGLTVRAWGGWSSSNFAYDDGAGTVINITTTEAVLWLALRLRPSLKPRPNSRLRKDRLSVGLPLKNSTQNLALINAQTVRPIGSKWIRKMTRKRTAKSHRRASLFRRTSSTQARLRD